MSPTAEEYPAWLKRILDQGYGRRFSPKIVRLWGWDPTEEELEQWDQFLNEQPNLQRIAEKECLDCFVSNEDNAIFCIGCGESMKVHGEWIVYTLLEDPERIAKEIKCAMCGKYVDTVEREEGSEFGEFYHCPPCLEKFRKEQEERDYEEWE